VNVPESGCFGDEISCPLIHQRYRHLQIAPFTSLVANSTRLSLAHFAGTISSSIVISEIHSGKFDCFDRNTLFIPE
jgi:hypothetical protein